MIPSTELATHSLSRLTAASIGTTTSTASYWQEQLYSVVPETARRTLAAVEGRITEQVLTPVFSIYATYLETATAKLNDVAFLKQALDFLEKHKPLARVLNKVFNPRALVGYCCTYFLYRWYTTRFSFIGCRGLLLNGLQFQVSKKNSDWLVLNASGCFSSKVDFTIWKHRLDVANQNLKVVQRWCPHAAADLSEGDIEELLVRVAVRGGSSPPRKERASEDQEQTESCTVENSKTAGTTTALNDLLKTHGHQQALPSSASLLSSSSSSADETTSEEVEGGIKELAGQHQRSHLVTTATAQHGEDDSSSCHLFHPVDSELETEEQTPSGFVSCAETAEELVLMPAARTACSPGGSTSDFPKNDRASSSSTLGEDGTRSTAQPGQVDQAPPAPAAPGAEATTAPSTPHSTSCTARSSVTLNEASSANLPTPTFLAELDFLKTKKPLPIVVDCEGGSGATGLGAENGRIVAFHSAAAHLHLETASSTAAAPKDDEGTTAAAAAGVPVPLTPAEENFLQKEVAKLPDTSNHLHTRSTRTRKNPAESCTFLQRPDQPDRRLLHHTDTQLAVEAFVICPLHSYIFETSTGSCIWDPTLRQPPACRGLQTAKPVVLFGGRVLFLYNRLNGGTTAASTRGTTTRKTSPSRTSTAGFFSDFTAGFRSFVMRGFFGLVARVGREVKMSNKKRKMVNKVLSSADTRTSEALRLTQQEIQDERGYRPVTDVRRQKDADEIQLHLINKALARMM
ncbi:unnamed protein product [Amoebophrya sp. A120]|nr:unnamed protein product [Amoebophrya sp. A120]|eukprot:GSA120T00000438001.1